MSDCKQERILFVSDLHGDIPPKLESISHEFEGKVIFLGDIAGTESLRKLQKLFYNGVYNAIKNLLKQNKQPTPAEILSYPNELGNTILDGVTNLWIFLNNISPSFTDITFAADYALELSQYEHFGHFVSNLPQIIKDKLNQDIEKNATEIIQIMTNFTNRGCSVYVLEGNWDARTPVDFYPTPKCKPLPINQRGFSLKKTIRRINPKILYFDTVTTVETQDKIFVFWPFDSATISTVVPKIKEDEQREIILVSHAQIDWTQVNGNTHMTPENQKIQANMPKVIHDLKPSIAIHGHTHKSSGYILGFTVVFSLGLLECQFMDL